MFFCYLKDFLKTSNDVKKTYLWEILYAHFYNAI